MFKFEVKLYSMRLIVLFFLVFPITIFSQNEYSFSSKKTFKEAELLMVQGKLDEAVVLFKEVIKIEPNFSEAYLNLSKIEFSKNEFKNALNLGKEALKVNHVQFAIYSQIGKSFFMLKEFDSSSYYFDVATLFGATTANDYYLLARSENNDKRFGRSLKHIEKALEMDGTKSEYFFERGNAFFGNGEFLKAKKDYEKSLSITPNQAVVYSKIVDINLLNNNPEEALVNIKKGVANASEEQKLDFLVLKGNYFNHINEYSNAEKIYNEAFQLDNGNTTVLINQSAILIKRGAYEEAVEKCSKAIELDGSQAEAYFNRGIAYEMLKMTSEACSNWEEAFIMGSVEAEEFINSPICNE